MTDHNTSFAVALVKALATAGIMHAAVTPGSRNTPLSLALADEDRIRDWSHHDERSAAFFGLGIAAVTDTPVVLCCTSGTAAAEYLPAVVEANLARVPLIVLTADRPADLRDVGAPQTIDQTDLYGRHVRWAHDVAASDVSTDRIGSLVGRLVAESTGTRPGPVHLNVRFDEPLMPAAPWDGAEPTVPTVLAGRPEPTESTIVAVAGLLATKQGVIVAGPNRHPMVPAATAGLASALQWPVLADPLSGVRSGRHDLGHVVGASEALAATGWLDRCSPEVVVRLGAVPTSKPLWQWLERHPEVPQVFIDPTGWRDPTATASTVVRADPAATLEALTKASVSQADSSWMGRWRAADLVARQAVDASIGAFPTEPTVARTVVDALPNGATLWVASSMPVRDLDMVMWPSERPMRIMANRGANGIDGFLSTAAGAATAGAPTVALAGDLSVLHDLTALAMAARLEIDLTVVAINNDGGGIFHLLPQDGHPHFERHFGTPHGLELAPLANALGAKGVATDDPAELEALVADPSPGPTLVEIVTNRQANAELHRGLRAAVATAVDEL